MTVCVNRYAFIWMTFPHEQIQPVFDPDAHLVLNSKGDKCQKALKPHHPLMEHKIKFVLLALRLLLCFTSTKIKDFFPALCKLLDSICSSECIRISECQGEQMSKIRISKSSSSAGSPTLQSLEWSAMIAANAIFSTCSLTQLGKTHGDGATLCRQKSSASCVRRLSHLTSAKMILGRKKANPKDWKVAANIRLAWTKQSPRTSVLNANITDEKKFFYPLLFCPLLALPMPCPSKSESNCGTHLSPDELREEGEWNRPTSLTAIAVLSPKKELTFIPAVKRLCLEM